MMKSYQVLVHGRRRRLDHKTRRGRAIESSILTLISPSETGGGEIGQGDAQRF